MAQKALTVSGIAGTDRTYNGTTADALSGTAALSGNVSGDSLTLNGPGVGTLDSPNAGTEAVTISGYSVSSGNANNDAANYAFSQPAVANVTIAQEALTLTATDQSKTYGFGGTSAALGTTGFTNASGTIYGTDITGVTLSTNDTTSTSGNYKAGTYDSPLGRHRYRHRQLRHLLRHRHQRSRRGAEGADGFGHRRHRPDL